MTFVLERDQKKAGGNGTDAVGGIIEIDTSIQISMKPVVGEVLLIYFWRSSSGLNIIVDFTFTLQK